MATKKEKVEEPKVKESKIDIDNTTKDELTAIAVKSITNMEEKIEAMDWKLWEIYNIVKNYVESNPVGAPEVQPPQPSTADIAAEVAKQLQGNSQPEEKKSVVGKLFGK